MPELVNDMNRHNSPHCDFLPWPLSPKGSIVNAVSIARLVVFEAGNSNEEQMNSSSILLS
jgi:hypothetical protein